MRDSFWRKNVQRLLGSSGGIRASSKSQQQSPLTPKLEELEGRVVPAGPVVLSINRTTPALPNTSAASVVYTALFDQSVTGVDATDFKVTASSSLKANASVVVTGSGASYSVTVNGIRGGGDLRLDVIDDDSIVAGGLPLGGPGANNGSFQGQTYNVLQTFPSIVSINRSVPATPSTNASSVSFAVTFSEAVSGVDSGDFQLVKTGTIASTGLQVTAVSATIYTVTVGGITGTGSLGLNLVDNGSIRDSDGNPLTTANAPASFAPQVSYATGVGPIAAAMSDVNGDGKADVVFANFGSDTVSVLLGNGDGTFQAQQTFATPTNAHPDAVAIGDLNGDGKPDLAVANYAGGTVSVFLGNGDGTFQAQKTFTTGDLPNSVAIADVNGDGKPDLTIANYYFGDSVSVLLGNGDGTFRPLNTFATGVTPYSATVGDVNGDGKPDVLVANYGDANVGVLLGNGDGTFQKQKSFPAGDDPTGLTLGDVNGDGKPDLAVANEGSDNVSILLGNGDGTFQAQQTIATGSGAYSVAFGDVNGDGKLDLAVANFKSVTVSVLLGNGDGTFQPQKLFTAGLGPNTVLLGDLNGDGRTDIAAANFFSNAAGIFPSTASGNFTGQTYDISPNAPASTTTTLAATPNASTGGTLVTFTATVAPSPGNLGSVTFKDNGAPIAGASNVAVVGGVATLQISSLSIGTHPISADYSGATGFLASTSNTLNYVVSATAAAPKVLSVTVNGNIASLAGAQRSRVASLVVVFDQPVQLDTSAMTLALHQKNVTLDGVLQPGGFGTLPASLDVASTDKTTWTVTFIGNTDNGTDGFNSIKDGVYDLNIAASKVHPLGAPGTNMALDSTTTFHRLFGDTNAPATPGGGTPGVDFAAVVNSVDNLIFRGAFNKLPGAGYVAFLDVNGDGIVNSADNLQFRQRFNKSLTWQT